MRPIDADALKETIKGLKVESPDVKATRFISRTIQEIFPQVIDDEPTIEVEPVKHGRWERRMAKIYACSECTNEVTDRQRQNYSFCPYCGALMDIVYKDDKIRAIKVVGWDGDSE